LEPGTDRRICGAKRRGKDAYCRKDPVRGAKRCRLHGGTSPRGIAHPRYTNGFYSTHMPAGPGNSVAKKFRAARSDPDLLSLMDDLAVFHVHMAELFERLGCGESGAAWEELQELSAQLSGSTSELDAAIRSGDDELFKQSVAAIQAGARGLRALVEVAKGRRETWDEIHDVQRLKTRTAAAEWRRQVDEKRLVSAEQAMALIVAIMHSVKRNCPDPRAQAAIAFDLSLFIRDVRAKTVQDAAEQPVP
jgi:hypothetical protein